MSKRVFNLLKYVIIIFVVIALMITFLLMEKSIPNEKSKQNILKSEEYYHEYFNNKHSNISTLKNKYKSTDLTADLYLLSIIYLEDNKHPWNGFIEMNKDFELSAKIYKGESFRNIRIDSDYSRYWNGQLIVLKPLLTFFTMPTIYNIYLVVFSIVFAFLLFKLFKHSKLLTIIFGISMVIINAFCVTSNSNLIYSFMISMISSIIIINMYEKKSKHIDLLFLITGMLAVYFDFISCETLTLTLPLFIYIYLNIKDNKKINNKEIIKYIILWLIGYVLTFAIKWILLTIHYNGHFIEKVIDPMKIRINEEGNMLIVFLKAMKDLPSYLYPYGLNIIKKIVLIISVLLFVYLIKNDKKNKANYILLLIVSIIPLIRFLVLSSHTNYHLFFTYRAILPLIMFILLIIYLSIKKIIIEKRLVNERKN